MGAAAPQGGKKLFRRNLQGKFASAPPGRARVNFQDIFAGWVRFGGIFSSLRRSFEGDD